MQILDRRSTSAGPAHFVPRLVRQPLDVVREVAGQVDDCGSKLGLRRDAGALEAGVDGCRKFIRRDLAEPHDGAGLVERAPRSEHALHQAWFGPGEHVSDVALVLNGGPQCVLDRSAVEPIDRLELVERDHHLSTAHVRQTGREREHFLRQP